MSYAENVARDHVNNFTVGGAISTVLPIPGWHSAVLTAAEATMAADIAGIYGIETNGAVWKLMLKTIMLKLGGSAALKCVGEVIGTIPVFGWLAKPLVAGFTIKGFGEILILYFEDKFPNQRAYKKPCLEDMVRAFGDPIMHLELNEYLSSSYEDTDCSSVQATESSNECNNVTSDVLIGLIPEELLIPVNSQT